MAIYKQFHTPQGVFTKELTLEEIQIFASNGDLECRKEVAKQKIIEAKNDTEKLGIVLELLDLVEAK